MKKMTLAVLCLISVFSSSPAKEYHITKAGSDKNPGTKDSPFLTISKAAAIARAGDTITVHEGIYRERVAPANGGLGSLKPILYRAAENEEVIIKGSEVISNWKKIKGSIWKVEIANEFFGDYNPYKDLLNGDWFRNKGTNHHTGEVFLNGKSLFEKNTLEEVYASEPYPDALDKTRSVYTWYCESNDEQTTIWANFQEADPNKALVEINVRPACFYPEKPGVNYIIVRGFIMDMAATQWAAPTAEQPGLIGTHWSKGWVIEDNTISNSKAVGITLGKDQSTGQNVWMNNPIKDGATHYNEVIFRALKIGWSKEKIGSHIVRNNAIFDCGQAGIVGSLGGVFSEIYGNHIYDIWTRRIWAGAEMGGIKIHAAIDMLIKGNRIHNTGRGLWIDWMAQGTRITGNLFYNNTTDDIFTEVNHGPYMIDNNIMFSSISIRDWSEGGAFVNNLICGKIELRKVESRFTPYMLPQSTEVAGMRNNTNGDNRYYNNVFAGGEEEEIFENNKSQFWGLHGYKTAGFDNKAGGNVYFGSCKQDPSESYFTLVGGDALQFELNEDIQGVYLMINVPADWTSADCQIIGSQHLGMTIISEAAWEEADGSPLLISKDYFWSDRGEDKTNAGPFSKIYTGKNELKVW